MSQHTGTPATTTEDFWAGVEVIHSYSRAQAIEDGTLVDVSTTAQEAGFRFPVAMTSALYAEAVSWDERNAAYQDEDGRLWDVLTMASYYVRAARGTDRVIATVLRVPNTRRATVPRKLAFTVHIGPGDTPEPVITLMLPGED